MQRLNSVWDGGEIFFCRLFRGQKVMNTKESKGKNTIIPHGEPGNLIPLNVDMARSSER